MSLLAVSEGELYICRYRKPFIFKTFISNFLLVLQIILDMRNVWCGGCGDTDSMTSSNISLNYPESVSSRNLALTHSPLSSDRLNAKPSSGVSAPLKRTTSGVSRTSSLRSGGHGGENKRPSSATGSSSFSVIPNRSSSSRVSSYRPNSFYGRSSSGVSSLKGYKYTSNLTNNLQGPTPDVLLAVVDIVNTLLIPYVSVPELPLHGSTDLVSQVLSSLYFDI